MPDDRPNSFLRHAKLIGGLTLVSRLFGLVREIVAGHYLGTALVGSAFTIAFTIPNLFRKLFGEGALSAAFIPLYAQAVKAETHEQVPAVVEATDDDAEPKSTALDYAAPTPIDANEFANAAVNVLCLILLAITVLGELVIGALLWSSWSATPDRALMLKLAAIMLPYVLLICGGAFLSGILQVHKRFGPPAAAPVILNACHIAVLMIGARLVHLSASTPTGLVVGKQVTLSYALAVAVLIAGGLQLAVLFPSLRTVGFRFRPTTNWWTPAVRRMVSLSVPVGVSAAVLQLSVLLDKGISWFLMRHPDGAGNTVNSFSIFGHWFPLPLELGAPRRLDLAQYLYQFPLGIFAIALATAIFPGLSADALDQDRERFKSSLRHGIEGSLWEGLPASVGLILVAEPAARLLFQHGQVTFHDATLIARSTMIYAAAIWAFSLLQIINRAYYAIHDTVTPLTLSAVNIAVNLLVELPLLWTRLGESGMAVGTVISFAIQAVVMLWMLDRKIGGLNLRSLGPTVAKMAVATAAMAGVCVGLKLSPLYPASVGRSEWALQLSAVVVVGAGTYLVACKVLGVTTMSDLLPRRRSRTVRARGLD